MGLIARPRVITRLTLALVLPLATAAVVAQASPPAARWHEATASTWGGAGCASGHLDGLDGFPALGGGATRCDGSDQPATFAVVWFDPDRSTAGVYNSGVRPYNASGQPRWFGVPMPRRAGTWGVCLMSSPTERLDCGELIRSPSSTPRSSAGWGYRPIAVDDPLVAKPVGSAVHDDYEPGNPIQPNCGGCF